MDQKSAGLNITIFFCQQIDAGQDMHRRTLEKELGSKISFFPLPCSGRIEPLHLLRSLEQGADKVYLLACPEGSCRYQEGNIRARKRFAYAQGLIEEIGLDAKRLELVNMVSGNSLTIDGVARELLKREADVELSPLRTSIQKE
jgi:F420-non-reducing hydrogenase iron-sulfur subunit